MPTWIRTGIVLGLLGLAASGATLYAALNSANCVIQSAIGPWLAIQLTAAAAAGVTGKVIDPLENAFLAGLLAAAIASISIWGMTLMAVIMPLPSACDTYENTSTVMLFFVAMVVISPLVVVGGGIIGWLGGLFGSVGVSRLRHQR